MVQVRDILRQNLSIRRDLVISKAATLRTGPEVSGCRSDVSIFEMTKSLLPRQAGGCDVRGFL